MNENKHSPDETAVGERTDYAVHFADGFFVPCPCCGKEAVIVTRSEKREHQHSI